MVSNLEPQEIDFDLEWAELRTSLGELSNWYQLSSAARLKSIRKLLSDQAFENKITRNQYTQGYGRVYKICIAVDPKSSELYSKISQFLEEKADFISKGLQNADGPELLEKYCSEWKSYKKAAEDINSICRYLNINHIDSKRHDSMEVQLSQGKFQEFSRKIFNEILNQNFRFGRCFANKRFILWKMENESSQSGWWCIGHSMPFIYWTNAFECRIIKRREKSCKICYSIIHRGNNNGYFFHLGPYLWKQCRRKTDPT